MCESVIPSPPVQPIARSRSGIGAVATMSLETTTSERRSSGSAAAHAFIATTSFSAVSDPRGGLDPQRPLAREPLHGRVLVDPDAQLERDAAQPACERGGLDRRRARLEHAGEVPAEPARRATSSGSSRWKASTPSLRRGAGRRPRRRRAPASSRSTASRRGGSRRRSRGWRRTRRSRRWPPAEARRAGGPPRRRTASRGSTAWATTRAPCRRCALTLRRRRRRARARRRRRRGRAA